jgi:hypothetical protein
MTSSLSLTNGTIGAPALNWTSETNSGLYRVSAGVFSYSIAAAQALVLTSSQLRVPTGAAATPSLSFISDTDTGFYSQNPNTIGISSGGALVGVITGTQFQTTSLQWAGPNGSAATPGISFANDADTGFYSQSANVIGIASNGALVGVITGTQFQTTSLQWAGPDGGVSAPGVSFANDSDTGIYRAVANEMRFAGGGALIGILNINGFQPTGSIFAPDGSAGAPAYLFASDTDTGIYHNGANDMRLVAGAQTGIILFSDGAFVLGNVSATVANPCFTFFGDPDTGFYHDTANQIGIALGGSTAGQIAQGTYTGTFVGFTTSPTLTVTYQRVGKLVMLSMPTLTATSNSTSFSVSGAPAIIRPASDTAMGACEGDFIQNGSADGATVHQAKMTSGGSLVFYRGGSDVGWSSSATTKGIQINGLQFAYLLN